MTSAKIGTAFQLFITRKTNGRKADSFIGALKRESHDWAETEVWGAISFVLCWLN